MSACASVPGSSVGGHFEQIRFVAVGFLRSFLFLFGYETAHGDIAWTSPFVLGQSVFGFIISSIAYFGDSIWCVGCICSRGNESNTALPNLVCGYFRDSYGFIFAGEYCD